MMVDGYREGLSDGDTGGDGKNPANRSGHSVKEWIPVTNHKTHNPHIHALIVKQTLN